MSNRSRICERFSKTYWTSCGSGSCEIGSKRFRPPTAKHSNGCLTTKQPLSGLGTISPPDCAGEMDAIGLMVRLGLGSRPFSSTSLATRTLESFSTSGRMTDPSCVPDSFSGEPVHHFKNPNWGSFGPFYMKVSASIRD
jgi:hypothetical protein